MTERLLKHVRFGRAFGFLKRTISKRARQKRRVRDLYQRIGLEESGCRLCGGKDFTLLAESDRYGFDLSKRICGHCGLVQTHPVPRAEFFDEFYAHHYRRLYTGSAEKVDYDALMPEQRGKGRDLVTYLKAHGFGPVLAGSALIEIGCSSGGILAEAAPAFRTVQGCDLDIDAIAYGRDVLGLELETAALPTTLPVGPRIFVLSHVLEHLHDPLGTLRTVRRMMDDGDLLCIFVPGLNMVRSGAYKHDLRRYFHIAHISDFSMGTLTNIAAAAGFLAVHVDETVDGIFRPGAISGEPWSKSPEDTPENILDIEKTYRRLL